jgi:hypothetical protein
VCLAGFMLWLSNFLEGRDGGAERLPAFEKILPGIGAGKNFLIIADIKLRGIESRAYVLPGKRHGKRGFGAATHGVGRNDRLGETVAVGIHVDALAARGDGMLDSEFFRMLRGEASGQRFGKSQNNVHRWE